MNIIVQAGDLRDYFGFHLSALHTLLALAAGEHQQLSVSQLCPIILEQPALKAVWSL